MRNKTALQQLQDAYKVEDWSGNEEKYFTGTVVARAASAPGVAIHQKDTYLVLTHNDGHIVETVLLACEGTDGVEARYALIGSSDGCVAFLADDEPMSEHRHMQLGDEEGYMGYPDLSMLKYYFDVIERTYRDAQTAKFS